MLTVLGFLKQHWRPLACAVALVLAYGAGRFAGPTKVHVVTVTDYKFTTTAGKERVVFKDRVVNVDRVITKVTKPDGTVTEVTTDKSKRETKSADAEKSSSSTAVASSVKTDKLTVSDAPRLTVMLVVGYSHNPGVQLIPGAGPLALGAVVNYRIAGPLTVGVGALTTGTVFAGVGAQF